MSDYRQSLVERLAWLLCHLRGGHIFRSLWCEDCGTYRWHEPSGRRKKERRSE
jgi:hypothetical protein